MVRAIYFENANTNGIMFTKDDRYVMFGEMIHGVKINRGNLDLITEKLISGDYGDDDFEYYFGLQTGFIRAGKGVKAALAEQDYSKEIYQSNEPERSSDNYYFYQIEYINGRYQRLIKPDPGYGLSKEVWSNDDFIDNYRKLEPHELYTEELSEYLGFTQADHESEYYLDCQEEYFRRVQGRR